MKKTILSILSLALLLTSLPNVPVHAAAAKPYVESDTTVNFMLEHGKTYCYKMTVHGTHVNPKIASGNGSVLQTLNTVHKVINGNDVYFFKVRAIGKSGQSAGVYTTLPGQLPVRHSDVAIPYTDGNYKVGVDIPAGDYAFTCAHRDINPDAVGVATSMSSSADDSLSSEGREYIRVKAGQTLNLLNADMIPLSDAGKLFPVNGKYQPNTYRVGIDIPAGKYKLTRQGNFTDFTDSTYSIRSTINFSGDPKFIFQYFYYDQEVTVTDGQFLNVHEAYLQKE